jgi:hypothetical protein
MVNMNGTTTAAATAALRRVWRRLHRHERSLSSAGVTAAGVSAVTQSPVTAVAAAASSATRFSLAGFGFHPEHFASVPPVPLLLGMAGVVPFVALAAPVAPHLPFDLPDVIVACRGQLQAGYGVTILSFLGRWEREQWALGVWG